MNELPDIASDPIVLKKLYAYIVFHNNFNTNPLNNNIFIYISRGLRNDFLSMKA